MQILFLFLVYPVYSATRVPVPVDEFCLENEQERSRPNKSKRLGPKPQSIGTPLCDDWAFVVSRIETKVKVAYIWVIRIYAVYLQIRNDGRTAFNDVHTYLNIYKCTYAHTYGLCNGRSVVIIGSFSMRITICRIAHFQALFLPNQSRQTLRTSNAWL